MILRDFIRLWNAGFGRSKNPVVGFEIKNVEGGAEVKYEIVNGDLYSHLESLETAYEYKQEDYEIVKEGGEGQKASTVVSSDRQGGAGWSFTFF